LVKFFCLYLAQSSQGAEVVLASLTPEGRIVLTLKHGEHTYSEVRVETGLSDRWLAIKLRELKARGVVGRRGRRYSLRRDIKFSPYELGLYLRFQAGRVADELAELPHVRMIVLFGGVAKKAAHEYSDLDLIVVVDDPAESAKRLILREVSRLESKYHAAVEPLILSKDDFLANVHSQEGGVVYGIAEGYEVLIDKDGHLSRMLRDRVEEIERECEYLEEERIWVRAR
jgi:predicted nucleotidyltransferase